VELGVLRLALSAHQLCSFEEEPYHRARWRDVRTEPGENEPVRSIDGPSMEKSWATHEGIAMTDAVRNEKRANDAQLSISGNRARTSSPVTNYFVDSEQIYSEDKLGCARGVLWAVVFQVGTLIAIAVVWTLRSLLR
jgi:hypothetical protein